MSWKFKHTFYLFVVAYKPVTDFTTGLYDQTGNVDQYKTNRTIVERIMSSIKLVCIKAVSTEAIDISATKVTTK